MPTLPQHSLVRCYVILILFLVILTSTRTMISTWCMSATCVNKYIACKPAAWLAQGKQTARPRFLLVFGIEQSPGFRLPASGFRNGECGKGSTSEIWNLVARNGNLRKCSPSIRLINMLYIQVPALAIPPMNAAICNALREADRMLQSSVRHGGSCLVDSTRGWCR